MKNTKGKKKKCVLHFSIYTKTKFFLKFAVKSELKEKNLFLENTVLEESSIHRKFYVIYNIFYNERAGKNIPERINRIPENCS